MICILFFVAHWQLSIFAQTFFLHRYGAHRQFAMTKGWERFFHVFTWVAQGSSYLSPRGYAILHRMHHAYSDTEKDPHSPHYYTNVFTMMMHTARVYSPLKERKVEPEARFDGGYPEWKLFDETLAGWIPSLAWGTLYTLFYIKFATTPWLFLLLPAHYVMGPIHGAIVNWCGHKYGYRNFEGGDRSKNTLVFDVLTGGELFQNNHHKFGQSPNFAVRWFEIDPTYQVMRVLAFLRIIDMKGAQMPKWQAPSDTTSRVSRPVVDRLPSVLPAPMDAE